MLFLSLSVGNVWPDDAFSFFTTTAFSCQQELQQVKYWKEEYSSLAKEYYSTMDKLNRYEPEDNYEEEAPQENYTYTPDESSETEIGYFYYSDNGDYLYKQIR